MKEGLPCVVDISMHVYYANIINLYAYAIGFSSTNDLFFFFPDRELYSNNISGPIPTDLGNLTNLVSLDLYLNSFTGPIPDTLGKLSKLRFLCVYLFFTWFFYVSFILYVLVLVTYFAC